MRLLFFFSLLFFLSCESDKGAATEADALMEVFPTINDSETNQLNESISQKFVADAMDLSDRYPKDTAAALPLYRAAEVTQALADPVRTAEIFRKVYSRYPTFSKAPESLFMLGFTYDESLNDLNNARETYQEFLNKYPENGFADDAEMLLSNLGKSDEEILRALQERTEQ